MRVGVEHPGAVGADEEEAGEQLAVVVALLLGALADDVGQGVRRLEPLGDDGLAAHRDHVGHHVVGVVAERLGEGALRLGLERVVELFGGAGLELGDQRLDVDAGEDRGDAAGQAGDLAQVTHQRLAGAGVLHLDGHVATVAPPPLVHLPDARGGGRTAVEPDEVVGPVGAEVGGELVAHRLRRHRRGVVLEAGEVLPVRRRQLVGQGGLEHAERLAELHRAALELAQRLEELLGRALLHLGEHGVRRSAAQAAPEAHRRTTRVAQRQGGEAGAAGEGLARELGHEAQCRRSVVTEVARDGMRAWSRAVSSPPCSGPGG